MANSGEAAGTILQNSPYLTCREANTSNSRLEVACKAGASRYLNLQHSATGGPKDICGCMFFLHIRFSMFIQRLSNFTTEQFPGAYSGE